MIGNSVKKKDHDAKISGQASYLFLNKVPELKEIKADDEYIRIGAVSDIVIRRPDIPVQKFPGGTAAAKASATAKAPA